MQAEPIEIDVPGVRVLRLPERYEVWNQRG